MSANNLHEYLQDIANAIMERRGDYEPINAKYFSEEIRKLKGAETESIADLIVTRTIEEYESELKNIGAKAFEECRKLKRVSLPEATTINFGAFYNCTALTDVSFPKATFIGVQLFWGCTALEEIAIPSVTSLTSNTFRLCSKLKRVDLSVVNNIDNNAFLGCTSLETLILRAPSVCTIAASTIFNDTPIANGTGYIYVPDDFVDSYKAQTNWLSVADQIKGLSELPQE